MVSVPGKPDTRALVDMFKTNQIMGYTAKLYQLTEMSPSMVLLELTQEGRTENKNDVRWR